MPSESETNIMREDTEALLRPQSLSDVVYEAVLQRLLSPETQPDSRLSVDDLARRLGVSQTPIREALNRLEALGLVAKTHLRGYRTMLPLTEAQFDQLYEARVQLEPFIAAKAATVIDSATLDRLHALLDARSAASSTGSASLVFGARVDTEFHRTIAEASGNLVIARILDSLQVQVQFALLKKRVEPFDARPASTEHRNILKALRKRDSAAASDLMHKHLAASRARYWPRTGV